MRCPPCHTPMSVMEFVDRTEAATLMWVKGWHCGRCGYGVNPLAEFNRRFAEVPEERPAVRESIPLGEDC